MKKWMIGVAAAMITVILVISGILIYRNGIYDIEISVSKTALRLGEDAEITAKACW